MKLIYAVCLTVVLCVGIICLTVNKYYERWTTGGYSQVQKIGAYGYLWEKKV
jgi:hypothetical protein